MGFVQEIIASNVNHRYIRKKSSPYSKQVFIRKYFLNLWICGDTILSAAERRGTKNLPLGEK